LEYGVKVTGATVHFVNEIPDGGKIIMQKAVAINDDDTPETLQKRVMQEAEWKILPLAVEKVSNELKLEDN
jgi:phosphoribosylglycinamide formyltransferase-1